MTSATSAALFTRESAAGDVEITWPWGTDSLNALLTVPTVSRASTTRCSASAWVRPISLGTAYRSGPCETVSVTVDPRLTSRPEGGSPIRTTPALIVSSNALTTLASRWAAASAFSATRVVEPVTLGTVVRPPGPAVKNNRAAAAATRTKATSATALLRPRQGPAPGRFRRRTERLNPAPTDAPPAGTTTVRDGLVVGSGAAPSARGCRSSSAGDSACRD